MQKTEEPTEVNNQQSHRRQED